MKPILIGLLMFLLAFSAVAWALMTGKPTIAAGACFLGLACYIVGHILEKCRHAE